MGHDFHLRSSHLLHLLPTYVARLADEPCHDGEAAAKPELLQKRNGIGESI